ncbi:Cullin family-domain-containing protein [Cunninghamella echinulata]|nr:Cullin family-domain-containing protein [Cunninghamella echinulata]
MGQLLAAGIGSLENRSTMLSRNITKKHGPEDLEQSPFNKRKRTENFFNITEAKFRNISINDDNMNIDLNATMNNNNNHTSFNNSSKNNNTNNNINNFINTNTSNYINNNNASINKSDINNSSRNGNNNINSNKNRNISEINNDFKMYGFESSPTQKPQNVVDNTPEHHKFHIIENNTRDTNNSESTTDHCTNELVNHNHHSEHRSRCSNICTAPLKSLIGFNKKKSRSKIIIIEKENNAQESKIDKLNMDTVLDLFLATIDSFFECIFNEQSMDFNLGQIGQQCRHICQQIDGDQIYVKIHSSLNTAIKNICCKLRIAPFQSTDFLQHMIETWEDYYGKLNVINELFNQVNSSYVIPKTKYLSIKDMGKQLYIEALIKDKLIRERTISSTIYIFSRLRHRYEVDTDLIHSIMKFLYKDLCIYTDLFEQRLSKSIKEYYNERAINGINSLSTELYLAFSLDLILRESYYEREIFHLYIPPKLSFTDIAVNELLITHLEPILQEFDLLLEYKPLLKALYRFIHRSKVVAELQTALSNYAKTTLSKRIASITTDDTNFVNTCLEFKSFIHGIIGTCFNNDVMLISACKEVIRITINNHIKSAVLLASYFERALISNTPERFHYYIDNGLDLFGYLQAKDIFKSCFKVNLARNLLRNSNTEVIDNGLTMINRLREYCGNEFVNVLNNMIEDIKLSKELNESFKLTQKNDDVLNVNKLFVSTLTGAFWPFKAIDAKVYFPNEYLDLLKLYKEYYRSIYPHRKLTWMNSLGTCEIDANFPSYSFKMKTTLYQATILLFFNLKNIPFWTCSQIVNATKIDKNVVKHELSTLTTSKTPLLIRKDSNDELILPSSEIIKPIKDSDRFYFNFELKNISNINISNILHTPIELIAFNDQTIERHVLFERKDKIQALILRVLKKHRELKLTDLVKIMQESQKKLYISIQFDSIISILDELVILGYIKKDSNGRLLYSE